MRYCIVCLFTLFFNVSTLFPHTTKSHDCPFDRKKMAIFSVYVVNKAGGLIYQYDNYVPRTEVEKTFSFPLDLVLKIHDEKVVVSFGQRDGIRGACYVSANHPMHVLIHIYMSGNLLFLWIIWIVFFVQSVTRFFPLTEWMWMASTRLKGRRYRNIWKILLTIRCPSNSADRDSRPMRNSCWPQCFTRE